MQLEKQMVNDKMLNEDELETLEERMREENERLLESNKVLKVGAPRPFVSFFLLTESAASNFANG